MVHQYDSQAWKRIAVRCGQVPAHLVFRQQQAAGIRIVAAEPRAVQAHDVNRMSPAGQFDGRPIAQARRFRASQIVCDPGAVCTLALEDGGFPGVFEAKGWAGTDAIHPAGDAQEIAGRGEPHTRRRPRIRSYVASDVVVAGNDEQTIDAEVKFRAECAEEVRDFRVLLGLAGLRGIAGEKDELNRSLFLDQRFQIS